MLSYSRGPDEPLWEMTIGQVLDQAVERWGDCLALVSRHQSKRYSWRELREQADCVARGLWSLGIQAWRSRRPMVHQLRGMGDGASGLRAGGRDSGQCQSCLPRA